MTKKDIKKSCGETKCNECPFDKTETLCKCAMRFHQFNGHSFEYIIKEIKEEIEKVEKEIK